MNEKVDDMYKFYKLTKGSGESMGFYEFLGLVKFEARVLYTISLNTIVTS